MNEGYEIKYENMRYDNLLVGKRYAGWKNFNNRIWSYILGTYLHYLDLLKDAWELIGIWVRDGPDNLLGPNPMNRGESQTTILPSGNQLTCMP
jgi:hypothetical protein